MPGKRLIIVDGYSLLFRAFFATRYLSTSDGRPTNALFGFVSMLFNLIEAQRPDAVLVAFDAPGKTFRHTEYAEYKGTRRETPNELHVQLAQSRELIAAIGLTSLELVGYEADDVIGTISRKAEENGYDTTIVTGDLDALQLVDECVSVVTSRQGVTDVITYTPEAVMDRYGFKPTSIPDYKALVGDTSDNIPGVPGVGEKTASKLIMLFETVEQLLERFDEVEEKVRRKIEPHREQLLKSKWLATIDCNVPIEYDFAPYVLSAEQMDAARAMLESLEFRTHSRRLQVVLGPYVQGTGQAAVEEVSEALEPSIGTRLTDLSQVERWLSDRPFSMVAGQPAAQPSMFADETLEADCYLAVEREVRPMPASLLKPLLDRRAAASILHDSKSLYRKLDCLGPAPRFDSMLGGYVLQSGRSGYALQDLVHGYLDVQRPDTAERQAMGLYLLEGEMRERLRRESQTAVLDEIELPLVPILACMEREGVLVSREFLQEFSASLDVSIEATAKRVYELADCEFLIASPKQLGEVLFERLQIPAAKKTKTGYATGAEVLQQLATAFPICQEVLTWRELTKLKSTYADALPKLIAEDGRIHTTFNQTVAATGRLSSNEPNLQNIPVRTELGRKIRRAFVAAPGFRLASFDYSQIELRLLAHLCRDQALLDAFQEGIDVHAVTAALMFNMQPADVSSEQRRLAKMLNYAVLYGVTDFGLASQLGEGFSISEAKALITQYFERFPSVKAFTLSVIEDARHKGFTTTLFGRRRYFPDIHAANRAERLYAERQAINAPIQGAAADMIKLAMIKVQQLLDGRRTRLLLQVHDELLFELAEGEEALIEPIREVMQEAMPVDVPAEVDCKVGPNWGQMDPVPALASTAAT